jgi:hypothetical protein
LCQKENLEIGLCELDIWRQRLGNGKNDRWIDVGFLWICVLWWLDFMRYQVKDDEILLLICLLLGGCTKKNHTETARNSGKSFSW